MSIQYFSKAVPLFYGNRRSLSLTLGKASVQFGDGSMTWEEVERESVEKDRSLRVPLQVVGRKALNRIGDGSSLLPDPSGRQNQKHAKKITIYTNANDTALNLALRFFGWPRLGAPVKWA